VPICGAPKLDRVKKKKKEIIAVGWSRTFPDSEDGVSIHVLFSSKHFCVVVDPTRIFKGANQLRCPLSLWKCQH